MSATAAKRRSSTSFQDVIAEVGILDPLPRKWSSGIVEDFTHQRAQMHPSVASKRPSFLNLTENRQNYYNSLPSPRLKKTEGNITNNGVLFYSRHAVEDANQAHRAQHGRSKSLMASRSSDDSGNVSQEVLTLDHKKFFNIADVSPEHSPLPLIKSCSDLYTAYHQRALAAASVSTPTSHLRLQSYIVAEEGHTATPPAYTRQSSAVQTEPVAFES